MSLKCDAINESLRKRRVAVSACVAFVDVGVSAVAAAVSAVLQLKSGGNGDRSIDFNTKVSQRTQKKTQVFSSSLLSSFKSLTILRERQERVETIGYKMLTHTLVCVFISITKIFACIVCFCMPFWSRCFSCCCCCC